MVLRPDSIRQRLAKLEEVVSNLRDLGPVGAGLLESDYRTAWIAERGLQLGAECLFDIGNHILSAHFGSAAEDYEDVIVQLGARSVIGKQLRQRITGLGSFRNILVHGYLRLDPERVAAHLATAPRDFDDFATAVRQWLGGIPSG